MNPHPLSSHNSDIHYHLTSPVQIPITPRNFTVGVPRNSTFLGLPYTEVAQLIGQHSPPMISGFGDIALIINVPHCFTQEQEPPSLLSPAHLMALKCHYAQLRTRVRVTIDIKLGFMNPGERGYMKG